VKAEKAFGLILREIRVSRNLSQEELAYQCDLDRTFISLLERGKRQPTLTTILKLARTLGVAASTLVAKTEGRADAD
jgi:transcriptional regulator with XRE-family HTH domain